MRAREHPLDVDCGTCVVLPVAVSATTPAPPDHAVVVGTFRPVKKKKKSE